MSLLSREAEPAYTFLVDALLRVGEGQRALDVIQRAPEPWKSGPGGREREVFASLVAGREDEALPKLKTLMMERPADLDLLYVGIQALYRKHLREPLQGTDLADFDDWTRRYQESAGSGRPSVAPWRSAVVR